MNLLNERLKENDKFKQYLSDIKNKVSPISLSGLSDVGKSHILASTIEEIKKPIFIITYNEIQAKKILQDLRFFMGEKKQVLYFPKKEISPYDYVSQSNELLFERINALNTIYNKKTCVVVTTIEALMQQIPSKELLYKNIIYFKVGKTFKLTNNKDYKNFTLDGIKEILVKLGYQRNDLVEANGQFSVRGDIVDIGLSEKDGVRIEFWGDEVDSIRYFSTSSQRSSEMIDEVTIYPAYEYILESDNIENICQIDKYFNDIYDIKETVLDYLSKDYLLYFDEIKKINQRKENIIIDNNNLIKSLIEKNRFVPQAIENISTQQDVLNKKINNQVIYLQTNDSYTNINKYELNYREINLYRSEIELFITDITKWIKQKKEIILLAGSKINEDKIKNLLKEKQINIEEIPNLNILVVNSLPSAGFENYDLNLVVISLEETFAKHKKNKKVSSTFKEADKIVFADLKQGDFVVHRTHGIGQFIGVNTITADNITKDYIKIKYKNDDVLYVPTNSLDNVRKYIGGGENITPRLNKLGSKEWENTKDKVRKNLREVAKDLIELYAKRQKIKGFAFSKDTDWQKQFEDNFPYQETDDQLKCIEEVKKDMEMPKPMDRLLCGDVGYGKTEVAIRAAFKAVMDQKQVAYLVPTTVLANQQYEEFKKRMEKFAIKVEFLNRFKTKKQQEDIIKKLKI